MAKKNNKISFILIITAIIIILFLAIHIQQKDKTIEILTHQINSLKRANNNELTGNSDNIRRSISKNLTSIVSERPSLGGKWYLSEIKFIKKDLVYIEYEDGHTLGSLVLKITNPSDYKTWIKIHNIKE